MKSEFVTAITQLAAEKGVPREMVMEAIQQALVSAYKQHEEDSRLITAEIDTESGEPHVYHWLTVVEDIPDDVQDDSNLIILEQARTLKGPDGQALQRRRNRCRYLLCRETWTRQHRATRGVVGRHLRQPN